MMTELLEVRMLVLFCDGENIRLFLEEGEVAGE